MALRCCKYPIDHTVGWPEKTENGSKTIVAKNMPIFKSHISFFVVITLKLARAIGC